MSRLPVCLCLASLLALGAAGCTSKTDTSTQAPAPEDQAAPAAEGGRADAMRDRADRGRESADKMRAGADRMREAAGEGGTEAAAPPAEAAPPSEAPRAGSAPTASRRPTAEPGEAGAAVPETPGERGAAGAESSGAYAGRDPGYGADTLRGRASRMRSGADRMRARAGGGGGASEEAAAPPAAAPRAAAPAPRETTAPPRDTPPAARGALVRPVDPDDLASLLPTMSAPWSRGRIDAGTLSSPVVLSQARVTYRQGSAYVRIEIVDGAGNEAAIAYLTANRPRGSRRVGTDGYERSATFAGYPSWETWQNVQQHGSLNVLVGGRFLVSYTGHGIASADILTDLGRRTDLRALEQLR